ncbi:hypothetical protein MMYC01_204681, partial [Madurella mycetomatis]
METQRPPPPYVSAPAMWKSKLALRVTSALFCIILASAVGSFAAMEDVGSLSVVLFHVLPPASHSPPIQAGRAHPEFDLGYCGRFLDLNAGRKERHPPWGDPWVILTCIIGLMGILGHAWRLIATPNPNQPYDNDDIRRYRDSQEYEGLRSEIQGKGYVMIAFMSLL